MRYEIKSTILVSSKTDIKTKFAAYTYLLKNVSCIPSCRVQKSQQELTYFKNYNFHCEHYKYFFYFEPKNS